MDLDDALDWSDIRATACSKLDAREINVRWSSWQQSGSVGLSGSASFHLRVSPQKSPTVPGDTSNAGAITYMNSLLGRLGPLESRLAYNQLWNSGNRKRRDWMCGKCRMKHSTRGYADDTAQSRKPFGLDGRIDMEDHESVVRPVPYSQQEQVTQRAWSLSVSKEGEASHWLPRKRRHSLGQSEDAPAGSRGMLRKDDDGPRGYQIDRDDLPKGLDPDDPTLDAKQASALSLGHETLWEQFGSYSAETEPERPPLQQLQQYTPLQASSEAAHEDEEGEFDTFSTGLRKRTATQDYLLDVDYAAEVPAALLKQEPDRVIRSLVAASQANDLDYIRSIPRTTFSEILRLLHPKFSIQKLANAHLELSVAMVRQMGITPIDYVVKDYLSVILEIVAIRRAAGKPLGANDYTTLLRCGRSLGNRRLTDLIWRKMLADGIAPTTKVYNHYMATLVFSDAYSAHTRQKRRVIPFNMLARQTPTLGRAFQGYRVNEKGLKHTVMDIFGDMLRNEAIADEESFRIVITAAAREGDLETVKSVLKKVWEIDADGLLTGKSEESIAPKPMKRDGPLFPTSKLLFTIAHAFGINNNIPAALRIVDFVARSYQIKISRAVWAQLFEWTFVLACPRTVAHRHAGDLPKQSVKSLWDTMTSAPYLIKPTMGMYNRLISNLSMREWSSEMFKYMEEGRLLYRESTRKAHIAFITLDSATKGQLKTQRVPIEQLRTRWEYLDLLRKRNLLWFQRWLRLLLGNNSSWGSLSHQDDWNLHQLPRILWMWRAFAPTEVTYQIPSGTVSLLFRNQIEIDQSRDVRHGIYREQEQVLGRTPRYVGNFWTRRRYRSRRKRIA